MRNGDRREKRKLKEAYKSGAGAKDVNVRLSEIFPYISWLKPYFLERQTDTNAFRRWARRRARWRMTIYEDVYNNSVVLEIPLAVKQSDSNISKVTGRIPFTK